MLEAEEQPGLARMASRSFTTTSTARRSSLQPPVERLEFAGKIGDIKIVTSGAAQRPLPASICWSARRQAREHLITDRHGVAFGQAG
jgi:hypothetical protein